MAAKSGGRAKSDMFSEQLDLLFAAAGSPTLRQAARFGSTDAYPLTQQRISDWRTGKNRPASFARVRRLIEWLIERAEQRAGTTGQPATALLSLPAWERLLATDVERIPKLPKTASPYRGLKSLAAEDRDVYFGRDDVIAELGDAVERVRGDGSGLVVVTGASGVGKSSLLGAGIARENRIPAVTRISLGPSGIPMLPDGAAAPDERGDAWRVLVLDQFENIFSLPSEKVEAQIEKLAELAADPEVVVVLGIRADFFQQCLQYPILERAYQRNLVLVSEMSDDQLREVITGPVRQVGGRIDAELSALLISEVHAAAPAGQRAGLLPLLAHVLRTIWERSAGNKMTVSAYLSTGGLGSAIADAAETVWTSLDPSDHPGARNLMLAMTFVGPRDAVLRNPIDRAIIDDPNIERIIDAFVAIRLVAVTADEVMLVHDIVLTAWPRLARWLADDREAKLIRQRIDEDSAEWVRQGRDPSMLYSGARLQQALSTSRGTASIDTPQSDEFVAAAEHRRLRSFRIRLGATGIVAALVIAVVAVIVHQNGVLSHQRNDATYTRLQAQIANLQRTDPSLAAQLLLIAHHKRPSDTDVQSALAATVNMPLSRRVTGHTGAVYDVVFSHDGELMASASDDRTARIWKRAGPSYRQVATLTGFDNYVTSVGFSPDARRLVTGSGDGTLKLWDIADPSAPRLLDTQHPGRGTVYIVRFSPDGGQVAAPSDDGTVTLYDVADSAGLREQARLVGHTAAVRTLAYSPDGRVLATGGDDQTVRLWDDHDHAHPAEIGSPIGGFPSIAHSVSFSPDGRSLAITGDAANSQLWNVADPSHPAPVTTNLPGATASSWSIGYSPSGGLISSGGADGAVKVWSASPGGAPTLQWSLEDQPASSAVTVFATAFSPDGKWLAAGRSDGTIGLWQMPTTVYPDRAAAISDLARAGAITVTVGHDAALDVWSSAGDRIEQLSRTPIENRVNSYPSVALSPRADQAATANNNGGLIQLWDLSDPRAPRSGAQIPVHTRYTYELAYSPEGHVLATGDTDRTVQLWDTTDVNDPKPIGSPLIGPTDLIRSVAFSPDGTRVAVTNDDQRVYVYVVADGHDRPLVVPGAEAVGTAEWATDGKTLVVAGTDITSWRIDDDHPKLVSRVPQQFGLTMAVGPDGRVAVGTSSHSVKMFRVDNHGRLVSLADAIPDTGIKGGTTGWRVGFDGPDQLIAGGDSTGSLYRVDLSQDAARSWICEAAEPISRPVWQSYFPNERFWSPCG